MPNLPDNYFLQFLILHGYWFAVPIMIIEGPIAQVVMGFFASFGFFNPIVVLVFGFFSDVISDTIFYFIGFFNGTWFVRKFGKFLKLTPETLAAVRKFFDQHGGKSVFFAKILTGMVPPIFITAGYSRMGLKKFYFFVALGGLIWSGALVSLGYFFGQQFHGNFTNFSLLLSRTGVLMVSLLALFIVYRFYLHKIVERRLDLVINNIKNTFKNNGGSGA